MKKIFIISIIVLFAITNVIAQRPPGEPPLGRWIPQGENLLSSDYGTYDISAVNEDIVWALMCKTSATTGVPYSCSVIRSVDAGASWKVIDLSNLSISYAVGIFALNKNVAWITAGNETPAERKIFKTTDGGDNWVEQYTTTAPQNQIWAPTVKFLNEQEGVFIDVFGNKSGRTIDGGNTWTTSTLYSTGNSWFWGQLAQENWWDIKGDTLWWGTSQFISRSTDGGDTWNGRVK